MIRVTWTAVKIAGLPFTYQLSAPSRQNATGNNVASLSWRRWIQFITITAMNGRKNNSSRKVGIGTANNPMSRLLGISRK